MSKKIVAIVNNGYRATLEEQDDPVIWLIHSLANSGASIAVVLRGNAVNYAVRAQDASGLTFGDRRQTRAPRLADDLATLSAKGVPVFYVDDDREARGILTSELIEAVAPLRATALPGLLRESDQVWNW